MKLIFNPNSLLLLFILLFTSFITSPTFLLLLLVLIIFPGIILLKSIQRTNFGGNEALILSCGIGVAFISLTTYVFKILNLPLNIYTILLTLLSLLFIYTIDNRKMKMLHLKTSFKKTVDPLTTILLIILLLSLFSRVYPIKDMNAPLFADPAVEGTIARLIIENQGIPDTWQPHLPLKLEHQPGFASIVAWFNIVSGVHIPKIILFLTNILHALFPLAIYLLANTFFKNKSQAVASSVIALIASFPTYIFVAGMNSGVVVYFLVPLAIALSIRTLDMPDNSSIFMVFLMSFGAILIHPIFIFFYILMFGTYCIIFHYKNLNHSSLKSIFLLFSLSVLLPLILAYPYFSNNISNTWDDSSFAKEQWHLQANYINPSEKISPFFFIEPVFILFNNPTGVWYVYLEEMSIKDILLSYPLALILSFFLIYSIYLVLRYRGRTGTIIFFWFLLFLLFSTVQSSLGIKFPGSEFIYPSRVKFLMALPLSLLISYAFTKEKKDFTQKLSLKKIPFNLSILFMVVPVGLFIIMTHLFTLSANSAVSDYDLDAMYWIENNIDKETVILNIITDIEAGAFIGGSAQWIPVLTGNKVLFPATSLTEDLNDADIKKRTDIMDLIENKDIDRKIFIDMLKSYNVEYVYISKNNMPSNKKYSVIQEELFQKSPIYKLKYKNEDVSIFRVNYA